MACRRAIVSASVDDNMTIGCFFDCQLTAPPARMNICPEIDFLSSFAPQSASLYASILRPFVPSNLIPKFLVPLRYRRTLLATTSCSFVGAELNCDIWDTANAISGRVQSIGYISDPIML